MKTPMEKVEAMLAAKQKPSYSDLQAAFAQCVQEREAYCVAANEITRWMSKVAFARIQKDEHALHETLDAFIAESVVPYLPADVDVNAPKGMVH